MIKKKELNQKDKQIWENYVKNPSDIYDKENKTFKTDKRRDRFKFDLHGYTLDDANIKVKEILVHCVKNKYKELLLITGKGIHSSNDQNAYISKDLGKLKFSVPEFIKNNFDLNKLIVSINDAEKKDGGEGAIIIKLKNL